MTISGHLVILTQSQLYDVVTYKKKNTNYVINKIDNPCLS